MPPKPKIKYPKRNYTTRLFKRFSQITGVPIKKLKPKRIYGKTINPEYSHITHSIDLPKKNTRKWEINHEKRHALQTLSYHYKTEKSQKIKPVTRIKKLIKRAKTREKWIEPTNADPAKSKFNEAVRNINSPVPLISVSAAGTILLSTGNPYLAAAPLIGFFPKYFAQLRRQTKVRKLIKNHGEDGMLLLWVSPPKKLNALKIPKWEKSMVKNGYLKKQGGLTRKGLQYFRRKLQTATVWNRLRKMEKARGETKKMRETKIKKTKERIKQMKERKR